VVIDSTLSTAVADATTGTLRLQGQAPPTATTALTALREHGGGRLWCVFGCGGDRDPGKRPLMGAVAERLADRVIVTADNPRTEPPQRIVADILAGMRRPAAATVIQDRRAAILGALAEAGAGDLVLVAGKGHEAYQIVGTERLPFSDRAVVLAGLSGKTRGNRSVPPLAKGGEGGFLAPLPVRNPPRPPFFKGGR
jgi:hypothetical protein